MVDYLTQRGAILSQPVRRRETGPDTDPYGKGREKHKDTKALRRKVLFSEFANGKFAKLYVFA
jgi:hypothetical protein